MEVVLVDDFLRDDFGRDAHEFGSCHDGVQVEVGYIHGGISSVWCGYGAIDVAFYGRHINGGSTGCSFEVMVVVSNSESNAVHFGFERFESCNDTDIADCSAFWNVIESYGLDGVGAVGT